MQTVNKSANTIEEGFEFLKEAAIQDYKEFINNENMIKEYEDNIQVEVGGSKFFKFTTGRSNQRSVFGSPHPCPRILQAPFRGAEGHAICLERLP